MRLEEQVASLELCKRLKELGVKQESLWHWDLDHKSGSPGLYYQVGPTLELLGKSNFGPRKFAAFTVAELGEMLPCFAVSQRYFSAKDNQQEWDCYSDNSEDDGVWGYEERAIASTEADARAKMLIHLLENKLVQA